MRIFQSILKTLNIGYLENSKNQVIAISNREGILEWYLNKNTDREKDILLHSSRVLWAHFEYLSRLALSFKDFIVIENCRFTNCKTISLKSDFTILVRDSTFSVEYLDASGSKIVFDNCVFNNVQISFSHNCTFRNCKFYNCSLLTAWENLEITDCESFYNAAVPTGRLEGYKKVVLFNTKTESSTPAILKLEIPEEASRVKAISKNSNKFRASEAVAMSLYDVSTLNHIQITGDIRILSQHNRDFTYELGKKIIPDTYNPSVLEECTNGIHFFLTIEEAQKYGVL